MVGAEIGSGAGGGASETSDAMLASLMRITIEVCLASCVGVAGVADNSLSGTSQDQSWLEDFDEIGVTDCTVDVVDSALRRSRRSFAANMRAKTRRIRTRTKRARSAVAVVAALAVLPERTPP